MRIASCWLSSRGLHGGVYRLALMRKKLVIMFIVYNFDYGLSGEYKMCSLAQGEVFGFAFGRVWLLMLYRFDSGDKRNDGFDLWGSNRIGDLSGYAPRNGGHEVFVRCAG